MLKYVFVRVQEGLHELIVEKKYTMCVKNIACYGRIFKKNHSSLGFIGGFVGHIFLYTQL